MNTAQHKIINSLKTLSVFKTLSPQTQMRGSQAQMFEMTLCSRDTKRLDSLVQYKHSDRSCVGVSIEQSFEFKYHLICGLNSAPASSQAEAEQLILLTARYHQH